MFGWIKKLRQEYENRHGLNETEEEKITYAIAMADLRSRGKKAIADTLVAIEERKRVGDVNWGGLQRALDDYYLEQDTDV